jgi:AmiR/NasT family two-component response regulator
MGTREIWVCGSGAEALSDIRKAFDEGTLLNPVRVIEDGFDFRSFFSAAKVLPLMLLLDLANPKAWDIIGAAREAGAQERMPLIALVDQSTEKLLDRAYEAGVRTYLRKPLTLGEFVLRAKMLKMNVLIDHPTGEKA